jgi:hypothetical protein
MPREEDEDDESCSIPSESLDANHAYALTQEAADKAEEAEAVEKAKEAKAAEKKRRLAALQEALAASPILEQLKSPRTGSNPILR